VSDEYEPVYNPPLGFRRLTRFYDAVMGRLLREWASKFRPAAWHPATFRT
jgi:hypothetical protein